MCSVHCALKLWTRVSPMWHHVCCCCTFSLSPLFIYAQITKPHSNHANMLMTFVSVPFFSAPEITWDSHAQWLICSCDYAYVFASALYFKQILCVVHSASYSQRQMTIPSRHSMNACMCLAGASMYLRVVPYLLWLHLSFDLFVCLFFTKARDTS